MKGEGSQYPNLFVLSCYLITMLGASCSSARNSLSLSLLPNLLCIVLFFAGLKYKGRRKNSHTAEQGRLHRTDIRRRISGLVENFFLARLSFLAKACCIYLVL